MQLLYQNFRNYSVTKLVKIIESKQVSLLERLVAGRHLAIVGDPRISALNPTMIDIPANNVEIGINNEEVDKVIASFPLDKLKKSWILKETPRFITHIPAFKISKYLITNQEFQEFIDDTQLDIHHAGLKIKIYPNSIANHPVHTISYAAALEYIKWISGKTKRNFRLLKEVEWEYAAAGAVHREYPWGNQYYNLCANTKEAGFFSTTPVGIFIEGNSYFGVADMAGNVEEIVDDNYKPYPNGRYIYDDLAIALGQYKICRGGSFSRLADLARCSRRHGAYPKDICNIGFRLAEGISDEDITN